MGVDSETFRYAMGHFATGVTVVTASADGKAHGTTVSAFASLSLNPPLVLVCLDRRSFLLDIAQTAKAFVVNVLRHDQEFIARHFASPVDDRLSHFEYHEGSNGQPILESVLASIECRLVETCEGGDHMILLAEVVSVEVHEGNPLLYYRGGYASFGQ